MSILTKIKRSVEASTGLTLYNHDAEVINELIETAPMPIATIALLRDTELLLDGNQNRERANVAVFFVNVTEFDFDSADNEQIIEEVKTKGNTWLRDLMQDAELSIVGDIRTTRIYDEYDAILTGIGFNLTVEETYGFNACTDTEHEPTNVFKITENGEYDIHNYYWVVIDVESGKPEQIKALNVEENGAYEITPDDGYVLSKANVNVNVCTTTAWGDIVGEITDQTDLVEALAYKQDNALVTTMTDADDNHYPSAKCVADAIDAKTEIADNVVSEENTWSATKINGALNNKENTSNKVTAIDSDSTDTEYPSAKCVYDIVGNIEQLLSNI